MRIGTGKHTYEWIDNWAKVPESESARAGWAHTDVVVTESGDIITYHQGDPTVLVFDKDGNLLRSFDTGLSEGHGMTLVREGGSEHLWIADPGAKRDPSAVYEYEPSVNQGRKGQAVKMTLDGQTLLTLQRPGIDAYKDGTFSATAVAVYEERSGGNGDVWVADGYGESYVHRYDRSGNYVSSINGEEGEAGRFATPHDVWVDTRKPEKELYIADRANGRIQVYDLEGNYKRVFGRAPAADWLHSPAAFAQTGDLLIVAELRGSRITVLDKDDELVCYLGENAGAFKMNPGWPNVPHETLIPGKCSSPHGIAADPHGNIYSAEWLIGGRINKLAKVV